MRAKIVNYLETQMDSHEHAYVVVEHHDKLPAELRPSASASAFIQKLKDLKKDGEWGDYMCIVAFARMVQRHVWVITYDADSSSFKVPPGLAVEDYNEETDLAILLHESHFYPIIPSFSD